MLSLTRIIRSVSTSSSCLLPVLSSKFPQPILEMSPQYKFISLPSELVSNEKMVQSILAEVLRCNAYFDETVFHNAMKFMSNCKLTGPRSDGIRLSMNRYIAIVFHSIDDKNRRRALLELAGKIEKCKIPMFKNEQELFLNSMLKSDNIPNFTKCMHKNDLALCYFRRSLEHSNWKHVKELLNLYPKSLLLYEHVDAFLSVAKDEKTLFEDLIDVFMEYSEIRNPYFMEESDFETPLKKVLKACSSIATESPNALKQIERTHISLKESEMLKKAIDEHVRGSKEAYVETKEYEKVVAWVRQWKKKHKNRKNVVVVDALNFGVGRDPVEWKSISAQFNHVLFASRFPPQPVRDRVLKRYAGDAVFCDKLSADDLIILRMALEFGPESSLVTNDQYRDHRRAVCNGDPFLERIWDDYLVDAVYRHHDNCIESRRDFNLRVQKVNGQWLIPVMDSEGNTPKMRNLKVYTIGKRDGEKGGKKT